jgi:hypothetical protein
MRNTILAALTVLAIGGARTGVLVANAQPAPPPASPEGRPPPDRPHWMGWLRGHHWHEARDGRQMGPGPFALIYPQPDRQLAPADVQKIAEGFLLWNGNHSWKVVEVAPAPDGSIGFALATAEGSVIARFTMDPHSGRVTRSG